MRTAILITCLASPAAAWDFTPSPICTLSHSTAESSVAVTYDATIPEYAITVTRNEPWPVAPVFAIVFDGPAPLTIQTDRHSLSEDRLSLTVRDRGFGNVLNGLELNNQAIALLGPTTVAIPLQGINEPITDFRNCPEVTLS